MRGTTFVLVHSPSVGPSSWHSVAAHLRTDGHAAIVPSLVDVAMASPPFWPAAVDCVHASMAPHDPAQPIVMVTHSNAGFFAPTLTLNLGTEVAALVFVDAGLPPHVGEAPLATPEFLEFLATKAVDRMLPPWTRWWSPEEVRALFPDDITMRGFQAEEPRLPLAYFEQSVPAPAGWDDRRCAYLLFSEAYRRQADEARLRGWPVDELPGEHLHMLVDPAATAHLIARLALGCS